MTKIGFYQFCPRFGQVDQNLSQVVSALKRAEADLIVLPELAFTGYYFADREELCQIAESPQDSATVDSLVSLCKERDFYLVTGFAERHLDRCFNSALLIGPQGIVHTYRKIHLFGTEQDCFDKGDTPLQVDEVHGMRVGMMICFDWVFPEVARTLMLQGADVICHPANLVLTYCQGAMVVRCVENLLFAITANRHGTERRPHGDLSFTGQSQIVAPKGELLHQSPPDRDDLHILEVDLAGARDKRIATHNDIVRDRRPDYYGELCKGREG
jgi:predicted amidohydrolase